MLVNSSSASGREVTVQRMGHLRARHTSCNRPGSQVFLSQGLHEGQGLFVREVTFAGLAAAVYLGLEVFQVFQGLAERHTQLFGLCSSLHLRPVRRRSHASIMFL